MGKQRCFGDGDHLYEHYHDVEWGRPVTDEHGLYERLCLEAFQAGLSWRTVLHKRAAFRSAFADFDPERVARYTRRDVTRLMGDKGIIRNRAKIEAAIANAKAVLDLRDTDTSLVNLVWSFAPARSSVPRTHADMPATTPASEALAKALRARSFRFVGATTAYATMQAAGLVNDHMAGCAMRAAVERERAAAIKNSAYQGSRNTAVQVRSNSGLARYKPLFLRRLIPERRRRRQCSEPALCDARRIEPRLLQG